MLNSGKLYLYIYLIDLNFKKHDYEKKSKIFIFKKIY